MKKTKILGAALAAGLTAGAANAINVPGVDTNANTLFAMEEVASPSLLLAGHGQCGAGKCGGDKDCKGESSCKGDHDCKGDSSCKGDKHIKG